jgi:hypothetical protein
MTESMNVEFAHKLSEPEHATGHAAEQQPRWHGLLETAEVLLLAIVAVATAWSGLPPARWDGHQELL